MWTSEEHQSVYSNSSGSLTPLKLIPSLVFSCSILLCRPLCLHTSLIPQASLTFFISVYLVTRFDDTSWGAVYSGHGAARIQFYSFDKKHSTQFFFPIWPFHRGVHLRWLPATPLCGHIAASFTDHSASTDIKKIIIRPWDGACCHQHFSEMKWTEAAGHNSP